MSQAELHFYFTWTGLLLVAVPVKRYWPTAVTSRGHEARCASMASADVPVASNVVFCALCGVSFAYCYSWDLNKKWLLASLLRPLRAGAARSSSSAAAHPHMATKLPPSNNVAPPSQIYSQAKLNSVRLDTRTLQ